MIICVHGFTYCLPNDRTDDVNHAVAVVNRSMSLPIHVDEYSGHTATKGSTRSRLSWINGMSRLRPISKSKQQRERFICSDMTGKPMNGPYRADSTVTNFYRGPELRSSPWAPMRSAEPNR